MIVEITGETDPPLSAEVLLVSFGKITEFMGVCQRILMSGLEMNRTWRRESGIQQKWIGNS
jgi:hypothetical protein